MLCLPAIIIGMKTTRQTSKSVCIPREILLQSAVFRLGDIDQEVQDGYKILKKHHKTVTIFGSARLTSNNKYFMAAKDLAAKLAKEMYTVVTGGGHGIMGAANQGAFEAGGESVGFNIKLPFEQAPNPHTTDGMTFRHFAPRKIVMTLFADAYVFFPGGFGTIDELGEILTLVQTGKTIKAPIILYGHDFWDKFDDFVKTEMRDSAKTISPGDENIYTITDDLQEIVELIKDNDTYCDPYKK